MQVSSIKCKILDSIIPPMILKRTLVNMFILDIWGAFFLKKGSSRELMFKGAQNSSYPGIPCAIKICNLANSQSGVKVIVTLGALSHIV